MSNERSRFLRYWNKEQATDYPRSMTSSHAGRIVIARPDFADLHFDMTVTMLLEHNEEGAFGLILNRPSDVTVQETFEQWIEPVGQPDVLFAGGPVSPESIVALGRGPSQGELVHDMHAVDLDSQPTLLAAESIEEVRIFAGYAGWAPGQLEGEIVNGGWWVVDGTADDVFFSEPDKLWAAVLRRQRDEMAWYAHYPADTSVN